MTAVPPPNEALLARGHELTSRLRDIMADLSAWADELPASRNESVDARMHADAALISLDHARTAISVFTQIAAEIG